MKGLRESHTTPGFRLPDETENRQLVWNNSILQKVKIELRKLGYVLISGISGLTEQYGLDETNVWLTSQNVLLQLKR